MSARTRRILAALAPCGLVLVLGGAVLAGIDVSLPNDRRAIELASPRALWLLAACALLAWVGFALHARRSATFTFSRPPSTCLEGFAAMTTPFGV